MATKEKKTIGKTALSETMTGPEPRHQEPPPKINGETKAFNLRAPEGVFETVKDICWWERLSITDFLLTAIQEKIDRMVKSGEIPGDKKKGEPYPPRRGQVTTGKVR